MEKKLCQVCGKPLFWIQNETSSAVPDVCEGHEDDIHDLILQCTHLQSEVSRLEGLNRELVRLVDDLLLFAKLDGEIVNGFRTMDTVKELRALLSRASSKEETQNKEA